CGRIERTYS
ncbi:gp 1.05, partial [Enterobacteria phage 3/7]